MPEDPYAATAERADDPYAATAEMAVPDVSVAGKGVKVAGKNSAGQSIFAPDVKPTPGLLRQEYEALTTRQQPGLYAPHIPKAIGSEQAKQFDQGLTTMHNVGGRAIQDVATMVRHPIDSLVGMGAVAKDLFWDQPREVMGGPKANGPLEQRVEEFKRDYAVDPRKALENAAGDILGLYASGKLIEGTAEGAKRLPPVKAATEAVKHTVTEQVPRHLINNLIRPSAADVKFGKNPAQAILEEGIFGDSMYELGERTFAKLHEVGNRIDQQARLPVNAGKIVDVSGSLKPIDDAILKAVQNGEPNLFKKLNDLKTELTYEWRTVRSPKGKVSLRPVRLRNLRMSPEQALKFKRMVGDKVRWAGNDPFQDAVNEAAGSVYGGIKDRLNNAVPGLKDLNERYSNLVGAGKAIERRIPVAERNAHWSLSDIALFATDHPVIAMGRKVMSLPMIETRVAQGLYNMGSHGPRPAFLPPRGGTPRARPIQPSIPSKTGFRAPAAIVAGQATNRQQADDLSAPAPQSQLKAEAGQRNPASAPVAAAPTQRRYAQTATGPNGHRIGSDDGVSWFDVETGQQVP